MGIELDDSPQFQQYAHPEKFVSAAWLSARLGVPGLKVVESDEDAFLYLSLIHISEPTRRTERSRMPSSA